MKKLNIVLWSCYFALWVSLMGMFLSSCNNKDKGDDAGDFDRPAMLIDISKEIILPAYDSTLKKAVAFQQSVNSFVGTPDSNRLIDVRTKFTAAREAWQGISLFEFGPAMDHNLKSNVNIYPTDTAMVENNILNGNYNLDLLQNKAAKGFPAIGYLLFKGDFQAVLTDFTTAPNAADRRAYLDELSRDLKDRIQVVQQAWDPTAGNYHITYINQYGTDVGSSLGMMVNAFNEHYERYFLDAKIGIPVGIRSAGIKRPEETEAYYQGISVDLALRNFRAIEYLYMGIGVDGIDRLGLEDHLIGVDAEDLDQKIKQQLLTAKVSLASIQDPLSAAIENDESKVLTAYQELKKLVVLFKSEMPSRLGVLITYQDNDGD